MRGDRVEVVVDIGDGTRTYEIVASRAGRRVETATVRGVVEVSEVTRTGNPVRTARFMANRVVAIVEHPMDDGYRRRRAAPEPREAELPKPRFRRLSGLYRRRFRGTGSLHSPVHVGVAE